MCLLKKAIPSILLSIMPIFAQAATFENICRDWYGAPIVNKGGQKLYTLGYEKDGSDELCAISKHVYNNDRNRADLESACLTEGGKIEELGRGMEASVVVILCEKK